MDSTTPKQENVLMAVLAYLGPLVIIPYVSAKDDPFVKFHIKQGLVLLIIEVVAYIIGVIAWPLLFLVSLLNIALLVLTILGIVNAIQHKEVILPIVGGFAKSFTF